MTPEIHNQRLGVDPVMKMNFIVEIDGITQTGFKTCEGLKRAFETAEFRRGNDPPRTKKQRGMEKIDPVTLTDGLTHDAQELYEWYMAGDRKTISIIQLDHLSNPAARWDLYEVYPKEFVPAEGFDSQADTDIQIRSIVLELEDWKQVPV